MSTVDVTFKRQGDGRYLVVADSGDDRGLFALGIIWRNDDDRSWSPDGSRVRYNTRADAAQLMVDAFEQRMGRDANDRCEPIRRSVSAI